MIIFNDFLVDFHFTLMAFDQGKDNWTKNNQFLSRILFQRRVRQDSGTSDWTKLNGTATVATSRSNRFKL
jgi:hypothetical protein